MKILVITQPDSSEHDVLLSLATPKEIASSMRGEHQLAVAEIDTEDLCRQGAVSVEPTWGITDGEKWGKWPA